MLDTTEEALTDAGRFGSVGTELPKCLVPADQYKRLTVGTRCAAALDFFVVGLSGWLRVCNHSTVELAPFAEIENVKNHPYWKRFTQKDYLPAACSGCEHIIACDGGCRSCRSPPHCKRLNHWSWLRRSPGGSGRTMGQYISLPGSCHCAAIALKGVSHPSPICMMT